jgi:hypothetical protein
MSGVGLFRCAGSRRVAFFGGVLAAALCSSGPATAGVNGSFRGASADGSVVAFQSDRPLSGEDTDTAVDIYVNAGSGVELASSGPSGDSTDRAECEADECPSKADADFEAIAADGTVVFSTNEQLVPEDQDHAFDIYTYLNGETALASTGQGGTDASECDNDSGFPHPACRAIFSAVSDNGRVYFTTGEPLSRQDTDGETDLYERAAGGTRLISLGYPDFGSSTYPSPDGSTVAYENEKDLVALVGNRREILIRDSDTPDKVLGFSADSERILVQSPRPLTDDDNDGNALDVYRYANGTFTLLTGGQATPSYRSGAIFKAASDDASIIVFETYERLAAADIDDQIDVYRTDGNAINLVSQGPMGGNAHDCWPGDFTLESVVDCRAEAKAISSDGSRVLFETHEALAEEDRAPQDPVFGSDIYEWTAQGTRLVTPGRAGSGGRIGSAEFLFASDDAQDVYFSTSEPLTERDDDCDGDENSDDIYRQSGSETTLVTTLPARRNSSGFLGGSSDGHRVFFKETVKFEGNETSDEPIFEWRDGEFRTVDSDRDRVIVKPEEFPDLEAAYSLRPFNPKVGHPTTFDSELSCATDGVIVSRRWDLDGDGSFDDGAGKKPTFTYRTPGEYLTALKVVDGDGRVEIEYKRVYAKRNTPPYADVDGGTDFRRTGSEVTFDAEPSFDPDGSIESISWDLDDDGAFDDASGRHAQTRFASIGDHKVSIRVTDDDGASTEATKVVRVFYPNDLPEISRIEQEVVENSRIRLRAIAGDPDGRVVAHDWDLDEDGVFDDATGPIVLHKFPPGHHIVRAQVTDDGGGVTVRSVGVSAPSGFTTSWTDDTARPLEDDPVHFVASSYGQEGPVSYSWDFDNNGTVDATGKEVDWAFEPGDHTVKLKAEAGGQTATTLRSVWVDTHAPVARVSITPRNPRPGQPVTLDSSQSYDVDGQIVSRSWGSLGSGTSATTSFPEPGSYRVPLTLTDEDGSGFGGVTTVNQIVVVGTRPDPRIAITSENPEINRPVRFSSTASTDPDGSIVSRSWDLDGNGAFDDATGPTAEMAFAEPGEHRVGLLLEDNDGLVARSYRYVYVVESSTPPPQTAIETGPPSRTRSRSATFTFSSPDQGVKFDCKLNLGPWRKCASPYAVNATSDGRQEFQVRSVKPNGTVDSTPARSTWVVDSVGPTVEVRLGERAAQTVSSEVSCLATERSGPCTGSIEILLRDRDESKLASGRFEVDPADKTQVALRLTPKGQRIVGQRPLRVIVATRSRDSLGNTKAQRRQGEL